MASADKFVGKTLYAKKNVVKYRYPGDTKTFFPGEKKLYVYKPGELIGVIWSWLQKNGKLYWMFYDSLNKAYYVEHNDANFQLTKEIRDVQDIAEAQAKSVKKTAIAEAQKAEKEAKGNVAYYVEKYAPWVIGGFIFVALAKSYIQKKL